jgi:hypothetical protein
VRNSGTILASAVAGNAIAGEPLLLRPVKKGEAPSDAPPTDVGVLPIE